MIKWFIDNLKPLYYETMISAQVTHFASLISIGVRIDEGIRSKKIFDPKALNSVIKQQVKRAISHKGRKLMLMWSTKHLKDQRVLIMLI